MKASLFCTFIAREFFERRDLFLVSRESGMAFP
jgi:hypothetical protein